MNKIISTKSAIAAGLVVAAFAIVASVSAATFTTNLKLGSTGADVKNLQVLLNMSPDTQVSVSGAGAPGMETSTFGPATKRAVIKFQNKYASDTLAPAGLTAGTGFVGALTRAKLNTMGGTVSTTVSTTSTVSGCTSTVGFSPTTGASCASGVVTTTPAATVSGPISVSLANDNPAASAVVAGQATADLAHFTFGGNGTITNVKLQRTGISSNTTLANVYLYQGNTRVADGAAVDTNGGITFNNLSIAVAGSVTLSVKADIATGTQGQIVGVQLTGYTVSGAAAMTSASISGNNMSVASASMAAVSVQANTVSSANVDAGVVAYTFWSSPVTVATRAVSLKGATFKYIGSAPVDSLTNIHLYVNGTSVGPVGTVNASTNLLSFDFGSAPTTLNTGASTVEVRADVMKGSNRNVLLSLQNAADLIVMDSQLGVNVAVVSPLTSSTTFTTVSGGTITINPGTVTTTIDPTFTNLTTVTGGQTSAVIGKFKLQAYGEDVKVSTLSATPVLTGTTPTAAGLNNVALYYNGAQVGSSQNWTTGALTFSLGSSMIIAAGTSGTLELRADLQTSASANYTAGTVASTLTLGASNGQGMSSLSMVNVPTATISTTGLTIATGALSISMASGYAAAQTVNPNTANVKLGSYVVQNTSTSESVRITNLAVAVITTGSITNLSNLRTTETSGSGATPINPSLSNNFSVNFTLSAGQSKTVDVMVDLGAATTSSTYATTLLPTAIGASSNVTLTPSAVTTGQTLTVQAGTVSAVPTLNPAPSSLAAQFVVGSSQNLGAAQYNFVATNGVATIHELKFTVGGTSTSSITNICVGGVCAPVVNNVAYLTGLNISVPNSAGGANVTATASFASVGTNGVVSNTTAIINLTYMKYTIGGVTTSTPTGTTGAQVLGSWTSGLSATSTGLGSQTMTIVASSTNPMKVGMEISLIGSTSSTAVGGLGVITGITSGTVATVNWATTTINIPANSVVAFTSVPSNSLTVVGTKPTVTIAGSTDQLMNGLVKLAEVTVAADAAGDLKLVALPISVTSTGVATTTGALVLKGTDGTTIASTNNAFDVTAGATGTSTITLSSAYLIPAGTSKTFRIYATAGLVSGAVNTTSLSTKLGSSALFLWNDMLGGVNNITGALIYNFPTDTSVIHN